MNKKGFTIIELLAAVIILSILVAISVPSVNYLIEKNKEDNYQTLKNNIISAAKVYLSDNRYNITLDYGETLCEVGEQEENISAIANTILTENKLPISILVNSKGLTTNQSGNITNPINKEQILDLNNSYVIVKYQCSSKDYIYQLEDDYLIWNQKN